MEWISVKDRLPDFEKEVLIFYPWQGQSGVKYETISVASLEDMTTGKNHLSTHWTDGEHHTVNPTHWMPLPEPPKP